MSFPSKYAHLIWEKLYTVMIPDNITLDSEYIRRFGVHVTQDRKINEGLVNSYTTVMLPVIKIVEYYASGFTVQVPSRDDMLQMHKDLEKYLQEWREHITYSINTSHEAHKELLSTLNRFSKYIYDKASAREVLLEQIEALKIGRVNKFVQIQEDKKLDTITKPDYSGIDALIKSKTNRTRFGMT
jgi:hypothetical protein